MYLLGTVLLGDGEVSLRSRREGKSMVAQALLVAPSRARRVRVARIFTGWDREGSRSLNSAACF